MAVSPRPHVSSPLSAPVRTTLPLGPRLFAFADEVRDPDAVRAAVEPLRAAFADHRAATEGSAGSYADVVQDAPRLAHEVDVLVAEHACIDAALARLALIAAGDAEAEVLRRGAREVLDELRRHGRRDSDLVHEAYAIDIGGE